MPKTEDTQSDKRSEESTMDLTDQNQIERSSARDGTKTRSGSPKSLKTTRQTYVNRTVRNTYPKKGDVVVRTVYLIMICVLSVM